MVCRMDKMCEFCKGKEITAFAITARALAIGDKCWTKAIERGVTWAYNTKLTELRRKIRQRQPQPLSRPQQMEVE